MSDVPKIVYDRLRAGAPGGAHPDADVLTAFAEQALSGAEREGVVRHLARCGDCREVVALSLPPVEAVAQPEAAAEGVSARRSADVSRAWFAWPNLRWAALAAGVVVVASVLVLRPGKQHESMVETVNRQAESVAPTTDANAKAPAPSANQPAPSVAAIPAKPDNSLLREKPALGMIASQPGRARTQTAAASGTQRADNKRADSLESKRNFSFEADKVALQAPAAPVASAKSGIAASEQMSGSREVVVVSGAANAVQPAPMEDRLMARTETAPAIEKAKPAAKEEGQLKTQVRSNEPQKKLATAYSAMDAGVAQKLQKQSKDVVAQWSLAQGRLERSLDGGATWQTALQLDRPLLSFGARGSDVWAGGQAGTLFHSTDSGATWTMVQPSTKAESLNSDIVAIEIRSPVEIVLSTSNNESWATADGGKTWEKK